MGRRLNRAAVVEFFRERMWRGRFHYTRHAKEEMQDDGFDPRDVRLALLSARWFRTLTRDPRGTRHVMRGTCPDGRMIEVVWRKVADEARILTVYAVGAEP